MGCLLRDRSAWLDPEDLFSMMTLTGILHHVAWSWVPGARGHVRGDRLCVVICGGGCVCLSVCFVPYRRFGPSFALRFCERVERQVFTCTKTLQTATYFVLVLFSFFLHVEWGVVDAIASSQ